TRANQPGAECGAGRNGRRRRKRHRRVRTRTAHGAARDGGLRRAWRHRGLVVDPPNHLGAIRQDALGVAHWLRLRARIYGYDIMNDWEERMHPAANVQFDRVVREFARWRAVPQDQRSQAPAWWWGPAFEVLGVEQ